MFFVGGGGSLVTTPTNLIEALSLEEVHTNSQYSEFSCR